MMGVFINLKTPIYNYSWNQIKSGGKLVAIEKLLRYFGEYKKDNEQKIEQWPTREERDKYLEEIRQAARAKKW